MRIVFYNAITASKTYSLQRMFNDHVLPGTGIRLIEANQHNLEQQLTDDTAVFVIPGARESSAYRSEIVGPKFEALTRRVENGMHVLGICAGAYVLAKNFEYHVYDEQTGALNEVRQIQSSLGLANIRAFGPDQRLYVPRPREEGNPWSVYAVADVEFGSRHGPLTAALAISRAPSFIEPDPTNCRVMARYAATGDAAMVKFTLGRGGGVLVGPALEVGGGNLQHYVHPRYANDPYCQSVVQRLDGARAAWAELVYTTMHTLLPGEANVHKRIRYNLGLS